MTNFRYKHVQKATFDFFEQLLSNFLRNYGQRFGKSRLSNLRKALVKNKNKNKPKKRVGT